MPGHLARLAEPAERLIPDLWIHFKSDNMQLEAILISFHRMGAAGKELKCCTMFGFVF